MKRLVVYYSYSNGNTEKIAERIARELHADIELLEPETPYSSDYQKVVEQAQDETSRKYAPKLKKLAHDPKDYDVIYVGTPAWWYTMSSPVLSFFKTYDLSGKTVVPFMTNAGWPGTVIKDMEAAARGANIANPKEIRFAQDGGSRMVTKDREVADWIESLK